MANKFLSTSTESSIFDDVNLTRAKLGLQPGSHIQSFSHKLNSISNLTVSHGKILKASGANSFTTLDVSTHGEAALSSPSALLTTDSNQDITSEKAIDLDNNGDLKWKKTNGISGSSHYQLLSRSCESGS